MKKNNDGRGFASMDEDKQREIAKKGGESVPDEKRSFSRDHELASEAGRKGEQSVPDEKRSFSRDHELASDAGRKGGQTSGGNFAKTDAIYSGEHRHPRTNRVSPWTRTSVSSFGRSDGTTADFTVAGRNGFDARRPLKRNARVLRSTARWAASHSGKDGRGSARSSSSVRSFCGFDIRFFTVTP